jgi:hypothetical protein
MGIYGNNILAFCSIGDLIYIDEPVGGSTADTEFDEFSLASRDIFLELWGIDGVYQPGSLNRAIRAIIRYVEDDAVIPPVQRHRSPLLTMKVPNDSSNGITAEEFIPGQLVSIPPRKGTDARTFRLARIRWQSAAFVSYEIY